MQLIFVLEKRIRRKKAKNPIPVKAGPEKALTLEKPAPIAQSD
jgi:hypothetical protein